MPFEKKNTLSKGRPKFSGNKSTAETKTLLHNIVGNQLDEVENLLSKLEPKEKLDAIIKLLPYVLPRQSEIAIDNKEEDSWELRPFIIHIKKT